jgi:hypothetical protein
MYSFELLEGMGILQAKTLSTPVFMASKISSKSSDHAEDPTQYRYIVGGF